MICKLQISQFSTEEDKQMLIYNEDRSIFYEDKATEEVLKLAGDKPKLYVYAQVVGTKVQITGIAPKQNW